MSENFYYSMSGFLSRNFAVRSKWNGIPGKINLRAYSQACNTLTIPSKTVSQKRKGMKSQTCENQRTSLPIYLGRLNNYHCHGNNWNMKFTGKDKLTMKIGKFMNLNNNIDFY